MPQLSSTWRKSSVNLTVEPLQASAGPAARTRPAARTTLPATTLTDVPCDTMLSLSRRRLAVIMTTPARREPASQSLKLVRGTTCAAGRQPATRLLRNVGDLEGAELPG